MGNEQYNHLEINSMSTRVRKETSLPGNCIFRLHMPGKNCILEIFMQNIQSFQWLWKCRPFISGMDYKIIKIKSLNPYGMHFLNKSVLKMHLILSQDLAKLVMIKRCFTLEKLRNSYIIQTTLSTFIKSY